MSDHYPNSKGVAHAITLAARAHAKRTGRSVQMLVEEEVHRRFLSRVFSEGDESQWILKGGAGMLARVPTARATTDLDLFQEGYSLEQALEDLRRLAAVDLGDHFRFEFKKSQPILQGEQNPYAEGCRVTFDVYLGVTPRGPLHVDLVSSKGIVGPVEMEVPKNALDLPRLTSHPYRVIPLVDQVADKVCATLQLYNGRQSSRTKDLVDLVVLARTFDVDGRLLAMAIEGEARRRGIGPLTAFRVPVASWKARYAQMAASVPACEEYTDITAAEKLVARLIDPCLDGMTVGKTWQSQEMAWFDS
ncbi:nucleotidyl transferase AbiEii/AbiGii toxin family protein [Tessaracoccus flavescens]|uniref:nucleotidyl transferase AbiEii/AbiGii toxin family protein n=1 Tax=Tessaracoccus flavescens TaxID=399497 RepID=UPI000986FF8D|nr:nucleotidyl transferase AbiEii/AbiGii toxin family protein [Tessaracoccus flavescens]